MPYQTGVIDQWTGAYEPAEDGKGLREALMIAAEAAANPADHSVVKGTALAGSVLRVRKDFETSTYGEPFCKERAPGFGFLVATAEEGCVEVQQPFSVDDFLQSTLVVPASGKFEWHMNPSTRPFVGKDKVVNGEPEVLFENVASGSGEPTPGVVGTHTTEVPFTVTNADATKLTVDLEFPIPAEDYDLELCKKTDATTCTPFGKGSGTTPGSSGQNPGVAEHIEATKEAHGDLTGEYIATIVFFAAASDDWTLTTQATKPGSTTTVPGTREAWTMTCETPGGQVLGERELFVARGEQAEVEFGGACEKRGSGKKPPKK
jgi:hypothetical protein